MMLLVMVRSGESMMTVAGIEEIEQRKCPRCKKERIIVQASLPVIPLNVTWSGWIADEIILAQQEWESGSGKTYWNIIPWSGAREGWVFAGDCYLGAFKVSPLKKARLIPHGARTGGEGSIYGHGKIGYQVEGYLNQKGTIDLIEEKDDNWGRYNEEVCSNCIEKVIREAASQEYPPYIILGKDIDDRKVDQYFRDRINYNRPDWIKNTKPTDWVTGNHRMARVRLNEPRVIKVDDKEVYLDTEEYFILRNV